MSSPTLPIEPPYPGKYRAGDVVCHLPTGETWCLAVDEEQGYVQPAGWPHYMAKPRECRMIKKASDAERLSTLRSWATERTDPEMNRDSRVLIARRILQEEGQVPKPLLSMPLDDFRWAVYNDATVSKGVTSGTPLEAIIGQLAREKAKLLLDLIEAESYKPYVIPVRPSSKREDSQS